MIKLKLPMSETRLDRFKRLATQRTNAILDKLRLLGNLSNKSSYEYTEEDLKKIFSTIEIQLRTIKTRFTGSKKSEFKLE